MRDQLAKAMDQAYWAVVFDFCRLRLLLKQHHIGTIEVAETSISHLVPRRH